MAFRSPQLCERCGETNFKQLLNNFGYTPIKYLGYLDEIRAKIDACSLCALVDAAFKFNGQDGSQLHNGRLQCFMESQNQFKDETWDDHKRRNVPHYRNHLRVYMVQEDGRPLGMKKPLILQPTPTTILGTDDGRDERNTPQMSGRIVTPRVQVPLLRHWLEICEKVHGHKCESPPWLKGSGRLRNFRVVDVDRKCLVAAQLPCNYVALSYVWGKQKDGVDYSCTQSKYQQYCAEGGLAEANLPETIKDAMQLTQELGQRYLWVDALCIIQDDSADKGIQITQMGEIYPRALLTIVAASGTSSSSGVARLNRPNNQINQQHGQINEDLTLVTQWADKDELRLCRWMERGWTFQENMLSRRRLIFLDNQVLWQCESSNWEEQTVREPLLTRPETPDEDEDGEDRRSIKTTESDSEADRFSFQGFPELVRKYQERQFGVEADVVDGLQGVLGCLAVVSGESFHWGLPQTDFDQALLWQMDGSSKRRDTKYEVKTSDEPYNIDIPSWSWMGWKGSSSWRGTTLVPEDNLLARDDLLARNSPLRWYKVDMGGNIVELQRPRYKPSPRSDTPAWKGQTSEILRCDQQERTFRDSGLIRAYTSHAKLWVQETRPTRSYSHGQTRRQAYYNFKAFTEDQIEVGTMDRWKNPATYPGAASQQHLCDFIVISEFGKAAGYRRESSDHLFNKRSGDIQIPVDIRYELDVMLIQWDKDHKVAKRLGIFSIMEEDWMKAKPRWEIVTLG